MAIRLLSFWDLWKKGLFVILFQFHQIYVIYMLIKKKIFPRLLGKLFQADYAATKKSNYLKLIIPLKTFVLLLPFCHHFGIRLLSFCDPILLLSSCNPFWVFTSVYKPVKLLFVTYLVPVFSKQNSTITPFTIRWNRISWHVSCWPDPATWQLPTRKAGAGQPGPHVPEQGGGTRGGHSVSAR